jgi:hypothetical protein
VLCPCLGFPIRRRLTLPNDHIGPPEACFTRSCARLRLPRSRIWRRLGCRRPRATAARTSRHALLSADRPTVAGRRAPRRSTRKGVTDRLFAASPRDGLLGMPSRRSSHSPGPMGQDFSGSRAVTSRNPLIHNGATNATWAPHFDSEGVPLCSCQVLATVHVGSLATANFRDFFFGRSSVNRRRAGGRRRARPLRALREARVWPLTGTAG